MMPLTRLLLLSGMLSGLLTISIEGAPATYDQRQTGELNVDGRLKNFLLAVSATFDDRAISATSSTVDGDSELTPSNIIQRPYNVEIVRIDNDENTSEISPCPPEYIHDMRAELEADRIRPDIRSIMARIQKSLKPIERRKKKSVCSLEKDFDISNYVTRVEKEEEAEREELSALSEERNEFGNKRDELVLLGDGVENCGPGRYRDKSGTCQEDKDFYSNP